MSEIRRWLAENGGPSVHLMLGEGDVSQHVNELMKIENVRTVVEYLDGFSTPERDRKTLEHLIHFHKENAIENFFPVLMHYGFRAGMKPIDDRIGPLREVFGYLKDSANNMLYGYCLMIHQCFLGFGYRFAEVRESFERRLDKLHHCAKERIYDIYHDGEGLPKIPKAFEGRKTLRFEMNPFDKNAGQPLPTIYDLRAMAYFRETADPGQSDIIKDITEYILTPEFQQIPEGFGLVWSHDKRRYHACGWSPTLPYYSENPGRGDDYNFLSYMETMSKFTNMTESGWYKSGIRRLEQYKTGDGTYLFPDNWLVGRYAQEAFLSRRNMELKQTQRRILLKEVYSTFIMYQLIGE